MQHPYFQKFHDPNDEPVAEPIDFDNDIDLSIGQWRQMVWKEMVDFTSTRGSHRQAIAAQWYNNRHGNVNEMPMLPTALTRQI